MSITSSETVFTVHWAREEGVGGIAAIYTDQRTAEHHAKDYSMQTRVLYAAVTAFQLDTLGTRSPVSWFRNGARERRTNWPTLALPALDDDAADGGAAGYGVAQVRGAVE